MSSIFEQMEALVDNDTPSGPMDYDIFVYRDPKHGYADILGTISRETPEEAVQWVKSQIMPLVPDGWSIEICYMETSDFYEDVTVVVWSSNDL